MSTVKISRGNSKLGQIPSVSLPSIVTCRECACQNKCYARKLEKLRPAVRNAYKHNFDVLNNDPNTYWREVEASIMMSRFFRFHVSGDIPNEVYFDKMVDIARRNPHCEILCFTKKYEIVNSGIEKRIRCSDLWSDGKRGGYMDVLPENLHMIFSGWIGLDMNNPYELPEAHVRYRNGLTTASANAVNCTGNCTECAQIDGGCWSLKSGEQVVFDEH